MKKMFLGKRITYVKKLLEYSSDPHKLSWIILFKIITIGLSVLPPYFYNLFINSVLTQKQIRVFVTVIIGYLAVYFTQAVNSVISTKAYTKYLIDVTSNIKKKALTNYFMMKAKVFQANGVGDKKNIIENDVEVVDNMIGTHFLDYYHQLIYAVLLFVIMLFLSWKLTIISMLMIPLSFKFAKLMSKKAKKVSDEYRKLYGDYESFFWGEISSYKEVKANCLEDKMVLLFGNYWSRLGDLFVKQQILWFANRTFVSFKDFFIVNMNLYFIGGVMIVKGSMDLPTLLVFLNYYSSLFNAISVVMDSKVQISAQETKMENLVAILDYEQETYKPAVISNNSIQLKNVSFRYDNGNGNVLRKISLKIEEKQKVAFVGRSGCGKTSLINLLYGLYEPQEGIIEIGGKNIGQMDPGTYGEKICAVLQNPCFFNNSIKYNLLLADKNASDDKLYEALDQVGLKDFVLNCEDKLDTVIGENGNKLSGGQKQRLALCRLILRNADVIILDEATSALDSKSESLIMTLLNKTGAEKTIVSISHRLSTIYKSDVIYVMDHGEIVASGRHEELKNSSKLYQELFESQFKEIEHIVS